MARIMAMALASALAVGCAPERTEGTSVQSEGFCCLGANGDVFGDPGCAGACVLADADGKATLALPWCRETACGRTCALLEDSRADYAGCLRACSGSRFRAP